MKGVDPLIIFKKDPIEAIQKNGYSIYYLTKHDILSPNMIYRIRNGENITLKTLGIICKYSGLKPEELIEYIPEWDEEDEAEKAKGKRKVKQNTGNNWKRKADIPEKEDDSEKTDVPDKVNIPGKQEEDATDRHVEDATEKHGDDAMDIQEGDTGVKDGEDAAVDLKEDAEGKTE